MTGRRHERAIARILVRDVSARGSRGEARLLRPQLHWASESGDESLARELGVLAQVEEARDEHLASLGPDEGLAALCVDWCDVVGEALVLLDAPAPSRCERCGARLPRRRPVCSRCRLPVPRAGPS